MKNNKNYNIEQHISALSDLNVHVTQIKKGLFFSEESLIDFPKFSVSCRFSNVSLAYHAKMISDILLISVPINKHWQRVNGKLCGADSVLLFSPNEELVVLHPEKTLRLDFMIPFKFCFQYFNEYRKSNLLDTIEAIRDEQADYFRRGALKSSLIYLVKKFITKGSTLPYQTILDGQDSILRKLTDYLIPNSLVIDPPSKGRRTAIVKLALEHIHAEPNVNLSISDIARLSFCSHRTLEYAFKTVLNTTPQQYIIKRRLNLIRQELLRDQGRTIYDIVNSFGVSNLGRFSQVYSRFFGELPSETRKSSFGEVDYCLALSSPIWIREE